MGLFRFLLIVIFMGITGYTAVVMTTHGSDFFPIFFGDITQFTWRGQFNLDFMCMLVLSGLWVAWRHSFSGAGLLLGLVAFLGGAPFLSLYLLVVTAQAHGDMREVMLGKRRLAG